MLQPETVVASRSRGGDIAKSVFDRAFALVALVFLAPMILVISVVILVEDGRPVFFRHRRIGRDGKPFDCLKFRTMCKNADQQLANLLASDPAARAEWEATQKLANDPRITCAGAFFRKTSFDEIPQFWNVLRGEMSVVGPRPIIAAEASHYGSKFDAYKSVKPGVTGLWQVSGRSTTTYEERVALDCDYIKRRSFWMDIKIIIRTVKVVLFREGSA